MIKPCNDYLSSDPIDAVVMFDKKCMDYNRCELARFAKCSKKTIMYLSFNYPKKIPDFDENLYPKTFAGESALTLDEQINGNNKDPIKKDIREIENKWVSESQIFEKKVEQSQTIITGNNQENREQLEKTIKELNARILELENENKQIKEEIEKIKSMPKKETTEITSAVQDEEDEIDYQPNED